MPSVFLYSDPHFSHAGVCRFLRVDGITKLRPWDTPEEMDEALVERYNAVVKPNDIAFHLGDFAFRHSNTIEHLIEIAHNASHRQTIDPMEKAILECHSKLNFKFPKTM